LFISRRNLAAEGKRNEREREREREKEEGKVRPGAVAHACNPSHSGGLGFKASLGK
jgi:hypothetical protein